MAAQDFFGNFRFPHEAEAVMMSDEVAHETIASWGFDVDDLRQVNSWMQTVWQEAARRGRIHMCRWLKAANTLDMLNVTGYQGDLTPLEIAMHEGKEELASWLVVNGADTTAVN